MNQRRQESSAHWWIAVLVVAAILGGGYYWYAKRTAPAAVPPAPVVSQQVQPDAVVPLVPALPSAPEFPLQSAANEEAPPVAQSGEEVGSAAYFERQLGKLLGNSPLRGWLLWDDFARRVVATVDNLPSRHVPPMIWPLQRTPGQLLVLEQNGQTLLPAENAQRYRPWVQAVQAVDAQRAAGLYRQLYPIFQRAYEDLGYPGRYFNDRLVQVIDHLLATPDLPDPILVHLPVVKPGQMQAADGSEQEPSTEQQMVQPWVHYEFTDLQLQKLSAGQKIMLRIGEANRIALKAKLREFRAAITASNPA